MPARVCTKLTLSSALGRGSGQRLHDFPTTGRCSWWLGILQGWRAGPDTTRAPCSPWFLKARSLPLHKRLLGIFLTHQNHFHVHPVTSLKCPCAYWESNKHSKPDSSLSSHVKPPGILSPALGVPSTLERPPQWLHPRRAMAQPRQCGPQCTDGGGPERGGKGRGDWRGGHQRARED